MKSTGPRLAFTVPALTVEPSEGEGRKWSIAPKKDEAGKEEVLPVAVEFRNMDDFGPINVVMQIEPLRKLFEARTRLADLLTKLEGNEKLDRKLTEEILKATDKAKLEAIKAEAEGGQN
jgi:type VI secretion system ImpB/VipA family protein